MRRFVITLNLIIPILLWNCSPDEESLKQAANEQMEVSNYEKAEDYLNRIIKQNPEAAYAYNMRGVIYYEQKKLEEAKKDYTKSLELEPENYKPFYNRGNIYREMREYQLAIADYNTAIELRPNEADIYLNRGVSHFNLDNLGQAINDFDMAIKLAPNQALPHLNMGKTLIQLGRLNEALLPIEESIKKQADLGEAYYWLAFIQINTGNEENGCENLVKAANRGFEQAKEAREQFCP